VKVSGISTGFPVLSQSSGQVAHVLLTRSPLGLPQYCYCMDPVRLACVKHAASVRPEPESNSPSKPTTPLLRRLDLCLKLLAQYGRCPCLRQSYDSCECQPLEADTRTGFWRISVPLSRSTTGDSAHTSREVEVLGAPAREGCLRNVFRGTSSVRFMGPGQLLSKPGEATWGGETTVEHVFGRRQAEETQKSG
jgi:hypothetical protein